MQKLIEEYRNGDDSHFHTLIDLLQEDADILARYFTSLYPWQSADLQAVANLGLVIGVKAAQTRLVNNNIRAYVKAVIRNTLRNHIHHDFLILYPHDRKAPKVFQLHSNTPDNSSDYQELLDSLKCTPTELVVIEGRMNGESLVSIGQQIGMPESSVRRLIKRIGERYNELLR